MNSDRERQKGFRKSDQRVKRAVVAEWGTIASRVLGGVEATRRDKKVIKKRKKAGDERVEGRLSEYLHSLECEPFITGHELDIESGGNGS